MDDSGRELCERLWRKYEEQLRRVCGARMSGCPQDAEDVISEVFCALCAQVEKSGAPDMPKAWLYGTLNNQINMRFRTICKIREHETELDEREYMLPLGCDLIESKTQQIYESEIKGKLKKLLRKDEYELICLIHFDGLKMKEAAKRLNSTPSAVKQKHYRICRRLRKIIKSREEIF